MTIELNEEAQADQEKMPTTVSVNPHYLIQKAIESGNVDAIERMVALTERLQAKWAKDRYFDFLAKFQKDCPIITKDSKVDATTKKGSRIKYNYASLDEIVRQVKEPLERNGFSYVIQTKQTDNEVTSICVSHHRDGHEETTSFAVPIDHEAFMNDAQKVASALTYSKRYAFCNAFGIMTSDPDDDARTMGEPEPNANEKETVVGDVPKAYWNAERGSDKQQLILTSTFGPAKRYEVRKVDDPTMKSGHRWVAVKIEDVDMTATLTESIKQAEETVPKGQGEPQQEVSPEKAIKMKMDELFTPEKNPWLNGFDRERATDQWKATKTYDERVAVYLQWKHESEERELKMV